MSDATDSHDIRMTGNRSMIEPSRRSFITGLAALVAAPAIVRAGSLMPIKTVIEPVAVEGFPLITYDQFINEVLRHRVERVVIYDHLAFMIDHCGHWTDVTDSVFVD